MTLVFRRRSIDVINIKIAAVPHLDVDGPLATITPGETDLPGDLAFLHCRMSAV